MRETKLQKIARLQRQKNELNITYKEQRQIIRRLSSDLKKQNIDHSVLKKYEDNIAILKCETESLRTEVLKLASNISNLERSNKELIRKNKSLNNGIIEKNKEVFNLLKQIDKPNTSQRIEDFENGLCKDRWGNCFFDDTLYPTINLFTGEKIDLNTQVKIMKVIDAKCNKLYDRNQNTLIEYQDLLYNSGLKQYEYEEKRHMLGLQIWKEISDDSVLKSILLT